MQQLARSIAHLQSAMPQAREVGRQQQSGRAGMSAAAGRPAARQARAAAADGQAPAGRTCHPPGSGAPGVPGARVSAQRSSQTGHSQLQARQAACAPLWCPTWCVRPVSGLASTSAAPLHSTTTCASHDRMREQRSSPSTAPCSQHRARPQSRDAPDLVWRLCGRCSCSHWRPARIHGEGCRCAAGQHPHVGLRVLACWTHHARLPDRRPPGSAVCCSCA